MVWNMEDAQNGTEDLKNGMDDRLPYFLHYTVYISKLTRNSIHDLENVTSQKNKF